MKITIKHKIIVDGFIFNPGTYEVTNELAKKINVSQLNNKGNDNDNRKNKRNRLSRLS